MDDAEKMLETAELGNTKFMYWYASHLVLKSENHDRGIHAYKWLFLATFLGNEEARDALNFLSPSLSPQEHNSGYESAYKWIEDRFDEFDSNKDISGWAPELFDMVKNDRDRKAAKSRLKLVVSKR